MTIKARKSLVIHLTGGSNCIGGFSTGGGTALTVPAGCTYRINGVNQTGGSAYPNPHSIVPGLLDELKNVMLYAGAIIILQWGIPTTDLASWIATNGPNYLADHTASTFGLPGVMIHDFGGGDSQDGAHLNAADDNQDTLYAAYHRKLGGAMCVFLMGITPVPSVAPYTFAGIAGAPAGPTWGLWNEQVEYRDRRNQMMGFLDTRPLPYGAVGPDLTHRLSTGQIACGRYMAHWISDNGLLP